MEKIKTMYTNPKGFIKDNIYCLWLLYLPCYLLYFARLQLREVPASEVQIIELPIDRMIPTIPAFFIPYAMWWIIFPGALVFFLFWGTKNDFLKLCFILFGGYTICMIVYTIWPNGLALREPLESTDLFSTAVNWLRSIDPPRNVCPSMHVSSTIAIDLVVRECRYIKLRYKNIETIIAVLICLSTMFIKQHSVVDVVLGWAMSVLLWFIWKRFFEK
ncbi:PAP2 superfamily protein [Oribacterium sp. KHPX15]|uniref:phosphatase PAP2 family protein n=1 Tax=Oribacterium sp. KHPX15 TaxID=1855342 RepID=UPI0008945D1F|nr:phosphatase PAP2 family protein [Oribacterium sp. KHPX15]SEA52452.1 PAP2 superfamily protein [Oribacterium sp. KHPX15]